MLTLAIYGLVAIVLAVALFLLAAYLLPSGEQIAAPIRDEPEWDLPPDRGLGSQDVAAVRLPVALRGYRFAETDRLLDRLALELDKRDAEIARLRGARDEDHERWQRPPSPDAGSDTQVHPEEDHEDRNGDHNEVDSTVDSETTAHRRDS